METGAPCRYLDWDSEFFGVRIARIEASRLTPESLDAALAWCRAHSIGCAYFLAGTDDPSTPPLVEGAGFSLVDVRVTLERSLAGRARRASRSEARSGAEPGGPAVAVRPSEPRDLAELAAMASVNHRDTRFYFDPRFRRETCDRLYATWIEKSCAGWADAVLVALLEGRAAGYVTCHLERGAGRIGLLGVGGAARGRGVGRALVGAALGWFAEREAESVGVATQGRNSRAIRLYEAAGFATADVRLWYHRWFAGAGENAGGRE